MLWYKSWLDTRWWFLAGLAVLLIAASGIVLSYGEIQQFLGTLDPAAAGGGAIGRAIEEAMEYQRTYRGFVWHEWFDQNASHIGTLLAALLGSASPFTAPGRGLLFSLSLPVARGRWVVAHAGVGLTQLFALAIGPALAIAWLSPLAGESYATSDALVHGLCLFVGAAVFFGLGSLLATALLDLWRAFLLTCVAAVAVGMVGIWVLEGNGLFAVMSGAAYFHDGSLPWGGLSIAVVLTAGLLVGAAVNLARRDF